MGAVLRRKICVTVDSMRILALAFLVACGSDEPDLRDLVDCPAPNNTLTCERACALIVTESGANCSALEADGTPRECTNIRELDDGTTGCCYQDSDDVRRFAECE